MISLAPLRLSTSASAGSADLPDRNASPTSARWVNWPAADELGVRAAGDPDAWVLRGGGVRGFVSGAATRAGVQAYVTADLRHHPADEHRRGSETALVDVAHWASEYPWCAQAAEVLRSHFRDALPVVVCPLRTDPWNIQCTREEDES